MTLDEVIELYRGPEAEVLYDEVVTELEHALQAAALAKAANASEAVIAAALLHDIGHLVLRDNVPLGVELKKDHRHDHAGGKVLEAIFGPTVADPVRHHVAAKRYLCAVEPSYFDVLSASSIRSLGVQGGPMPPAECRAFEALPGAMDAVELRRFDDLAKEADADVPAFGDWVEMLRGLETAWRASTAAIRS